MNTNNIPVHVGIMRAKELVFNLQGSFLGSDGNVYNGPLKAEVSSVGFKINGNSLLDFTFTPRQENATFCLDDVTIGIDFHWERKEQQTFQGTLRLLYDGGYIQVINSLNIEDYLCSVISSEMKATASLEFLKASAIISRSWLLRQMRQLDTRCPGWKWSVGVPGSNDKKRLTNDTLFWWFDSENHTVFDVCADDHCQRYQGVQRVVNANAERAVRETAGMVLTYNGEICDARFSKSCGGVSETYETCWNDHHCDYLVPVADVLPNEKEYPDLTNEAEAEKWILSEPDSFCNTQDREVLEQVLNYYDLETSDFYRWKVEYSQEELCKLIHGNLAKLRMQLAGESPLDLGDIVNLVPIERGPSGRLLSLRVEGTKGSIVLGKELIIRRVLSTSHLYSSAFVVRKEYSANGIPSSFTLIGAGWGHGAGMCQIGAAVMGSKGYKAEQILLHYFQNASIEKIY